MFHELILVCTSISGAVTTLPELVLADGSQNCARNALCKHKSGGSDGYACKVPGSTQDVQTTVCGALNVHHNRWAGEEIVFTRIFLAIEGVREAVEVVHNTTRQLRGELDTLKGRQAASAALQVAQFFLFAGYLLTLTILYIKKCVEKHQVAALETNLQEMESRLQERKAKRRSAAARAKIGPSPTQE